MTKLTLTDIDLNDSELLRFTANYLSALASRKTTIEKPATYNKIIAETSGSNSNATLIDTCDFTDHIDETVIHVDKDPEEIFKDNKVQLDSAGIPWDYRIHASTKTKTQEGRWKLKRGVDPELLRKVTEELKTVMNVPVPAGITIEAGPSTLITPTYYPGITEPESPTTPINVKPLNTPDITPPLIAGATDFIKFLPKVSEACVQGKISHKVVLEELAKMGLPEVMALRNRPDLIPTLNRILFPNE